MGLRAEVHVVGLEEVVERAYAGGKQVYPEHGAGYGPVARAGFAGPDEVKNSGDSEAMGDEELDGAEGWEVLDDVGSEQGHGCSGQCAVVGQIEDELVEGEQGDDDEDEGGVAEFKRQVVGKGELAVGDEVGVVDGCVGEERDGEGEADGLGLGRAAAMGESQEGGQRNDGGEDEQVSRAEELEVGSHRLKCVGRGCSG